MKRDWQWLIKLWLAPVILAIVAVLIPEHFLETRDSMIPPGLWLRFILLLFAFGYVGWLLFARFGWWVADLCGVPPQRTEQDSPGKSN